MSSIVGPWRLATIWGFPRATLSTKVVTVTMYITPGGLILNYAGGVHCCHHRSHQYIPAALFLGGLNGGWRGWLPDQAGCNLLEAWRRCYLWSGLGGPWWQLWVRLLLHGPFAFFGSSTLGPSSPHTLAAALPPQLAKSWRVHPAGITRQVRCSTCIQPGKLHVEPPPFLPSCATQR